MFVIDKIFNLKIDTKNKNITTVTGLKQFDNNSVLNITLLQNNLALDLSNCTIRINFLREDDKVLLYMANIVNAPEGKVSIKLSPEVLEKSGLVKADISVFDSNLLKITSATFNLRVEKSIYNDTYFTNKDLDLMQQEYIREKERRANETNRVQAENTRNSNENTRISNEEARKKAEDTRVDEWNDVKKDATNIKNTLDTTIEAANKTNTDLQNTITTGDKLKQELTPQNYVKNTDYEVYKKQVDDTLKENTTKNITKETNILSLTDNVEGIANITLGGNTVDIAKDPIISDFKETYNIGKHNHHQSQNLLLNPSSVPITLDDGVRTRITSKDNNCDDVTVTSNSAIPQMLFSFNIISILESRIGVIPGNNTTEKITWLKKNVKTIACNWYGYGKCPSGNKAYIKWYASEWVGNEHSEGYWTNTASIPSRIRPVTGDWFDKCIDSNGFTHILAYTDASDGTTPSTIYTDYINLEIQLNSILRSVGEDNKEIIVKSIGKNLCPPELENKVITSSTLFDSYPIRLNPNTDYTLYINNLTCANGSEFQIKASDKTTNIKQIHDKSGGDEVIKFNTGTSNFIYIRGYKSIGDLKWSIIQLEKGTTLTPYEPYKEDKVNIQLKEPLRGIPNGVRDTINVDGTITRRVGKVVLNGSENWRYNGDPIESMNGYLLFYIDTLTMTLPNKPNKPIATNFGIGSFYIASVYKKAEGCVNEHVFYISINKNKLTTQDITGFKKWLSENPITVCYELAEPIIENVGQPLTLKGFTNGTIQINTEVTPFITAKYPSNINSRINTVEDATSFMKDNLGGAWQTLLILADKELKMKSINKLTTTDALSKKINEIIGVW